MPYELKMSDGRMTKVYVVRSLDGFLGHFFPLQRQTEKLGLAAPTFRVLKTEVAPTSSLEPEPCTRELSYHVAVDGPDSAAPVELLAHFPSELARYESSEEKEYASGRKFDMGHELLWAATVAFAAIRKYGFVSRKAALTNGKTSTSEIVVSRLDRASSGRSFALEVLPEDRVKAHELIQWGRRELAARSRLNDYERNLVTVLGDDVIKMEHCAVLTAGVNSFYLAQTPVVKGFFGAIGERYDLNLEVFDRFEHREPDSILTTVDYTFKDASNLRFQWRTSTSAELGALKLGASVDLRGSVKNHFTHPRTGAEFTVLTRCMPARTEKPATQADAGPPGKVEQAALDLLAGGFEPTAHPGVEH
jgi:hypothetical protein